MRGSVWHILNCPTDNLQLAFLVHHRTMRWKHSGTVHEVCDKCFRVATMRFQILRWNLLTHLRIFPHLSPRRKHPTWCPNLRLASHTICRQFDLILESVVGMVTLCQLVIHHLCLVSSSNRVRGWRDQIRTPYHLSLIHIWRCRRRG